MDSGQVEDLDPLLAPEQVQDALSELILNEMPDLYSLAAVFERLYEEMDEDCPGQAGSVFAINDACTTDSGYTFYGVSTWRTIEGERDGIQQYVYGSGQTSLEIVDPDGETFVAGGAVLFEGQWVDTALSWTVLLNGTFHYPPAESWFRNRVSTSLVLDGSDTSSGQSLVINGGFETSDHAVYFSSLVWTNECEEPAGDIHFRESTGRWYRLSLTDDCTGCGVLSLSDHPIGEACLSVGAFLQSTHAELEPR